MLFSPPHLAGISVSRVPTCRATGSRIEAVRGGTQLLAPAPAEAAGCLPALFPTDLTLPGPAQLRHNTCPAAEHLRARYASPSFAVCPPCVQRLPARRLHPSAGALPASPPAGLALLQATHSWRKFPPCLAALKLLYPRIPRRSAYDPRGLGWGFVGRVSQSAPCRRKVCAQPPCSERGKNRRDPRGPNEGGVSKRSGLIHTLYNP